MGTDHHSVYLAQAISGLTPEGRRRAAELLSELAAAAGSHDRVAEFARERAAELATGRVEVGRPLDPSQEPSVDELDRLTTGFMTIRDDEQADDVSNWANAVLALLTDERPRGV